MQYIRVTFFSHARVRSGRFFKSLSRLLHRDKNPGSHAVASAKGFHAWPVLTSRFLIIAYHYAILTAAIAMHIFIDQSSNWKWTAQMQDLEFDSRHNSTSSQRQCQHSTKLGASGNKMARKAQGESQISALKSFLAHNCTERQLA